VKWVLLGAAIVALIGAYVYAPRYHYTAIWLGFIAGYFVKDAWTID
jgi:hypothetical protein